VRGGTRPIWVLSLRITGECNTVCSAPAPEAPQGATQAPRGGRAETVRDRRATMVRYIRIIVWSNELLGNGWNRATERSGESRLGLAYSVHVVQNTHLRSPAPRSGRRDGRRRRDCSLARLLRLPVRASWMLPRMTRLCDDCQWTEAWTEDAARGTPRAGHGAGPRAAGAEAGLEGPLEVTLNRHESLT
jgi:hypothetical protein